MTAPRRIFVDANVLAAPLTRTLLLLGAEASGYSYAWSEAAELEASHHLRPKATPISVLRADALGGMLLSLSGDVAGRFAKTNGADKQILADAERAKAEVIITSDVDDFAVDDLESVHVSAANPDLFMSVAMRESAYVDALSMMALARKKPPNTVESIHTSLARNHPRLFARFNDIFGAEPERSEHNQPKVLFRGSRCLRCGRSSQDLVDGLGPTCYRILRGTA